MNNDRRNSIAFRTNGFALSLLLAWMGCASAASAATQLDSVTIGFSSFSGFYGPLWLAVEDGVGKKYGVDLRAVYAGRVRPHDAQMGTVSRS
jgi:ABC-type nitrate/sulfonate/bicarbonate transport system substrate-binding protein